MTKKYLQDWYCNPDKYILPPDIIKRPSSKMGYHFAIYLGNKQIAHLPGGGSPTKFDSWNEFCSDGTSSSSSSLFGGGSFMEFPTIYHPQIPFKRKEDIVRHIAKVISCGYGRYSYNFIANNCEHLVNRCVLSLDNSPQTKYFEEAIIPFSSNCRDLKLMVTSVSNTLDNLTSTSSSSYEINRINDFIRQAENNRSYTRSKYQIEQEKFQERIEVYPKDWCKIQ